MPLSITLKEDAMTDDLPPRDEYIPRIVDEQVQRYLEVFGAVEEAGTKGGGKKKGGCRQGGRGG